MHAESLAKVPSTSNVGEPGAARQDRAIEQASSAVSRAAGICRQRSERPSSR